MSVGSSTAKQLVDSMLVNRTTVQKKQNGITVGFFRLNTDTSPTYFNVFTANGREQFVVNIPVGNHIPDTFFSEEDRQYLLTAVKGMAGEAE